MADEIDPKTIVPETKATSTVEVVTLLRDVIVRNDGTMTISREKTVYTRDGLSVTDMTYEQVGLEDAIPEDALTLINTRLGK